jgi:hypothetical protein
MGRIRKQAPKAPEEKTNWNDSKAQEEIGIILKKVSGFLQDVLRVIRRYPEAGACSRREWESSRHGAVASKDERLPQAVPALSCFCG